MLSLLKYSLISIRARRSRDHSQNIDLLRLSARFFSSLLILALTPNFAAAQGCNLSDNVSVIWTSPPNVDVLSNDSARWGTTGSLRFAFVGDWCPIPEDISFDDEEGNPIPATIFFNIPTQLVENGPTPPQVALIKPLMSLELSTDYTLTLSPPNPALSIFQDYTLTFRTSRAPVEVDYNDFEGIKEVSVEGNLCEGEGLYLSDAEDFDCIIPSYMNLKVSFRPLPVHEASYLIYRVSSRPNDGSVDLIDEVERPLAYVPGVSEERAQRSIETTISVLYAPFPREECFKVVVLDEWGRERAGMDEVSCFNLAPPSACSDLQFPEPNPFENTPPLEGAPCEAIGINGATGRTQIPPIEEPMDEEPMDEDPMDEEPMDDGSMGDSEDEGCAQKYTSGRSDVSGIVYLISLGWLIGWARRRYSPIIKR